MIVDVPLTKDGWLTQIDWHRAKRIAAALQAYIDTAPAAEKRAYDYCAQVGPIIAAIRDGTLPVPFPYADAPYSMRIIETGRFPELLDAFSKLFSELLYVVSGSPAASSLSLRETGRYVPGAAQHSGPDGTVYERCWFETD